MVPEETVDLPKLRSHTGNTSYKPYAALQGLRPPD